MDFKHFPDIEGFHNAVKSGEYFNFPTIKYRGKIKLHGGFSGQTLVTMADGSQLPISELKVGDSILSYDFDKEDYVPKEMTNHYKSELDKEWIELEFDTGIKIKCTKDHKFFTKNRGWVEAQDLTENDVFVEF